MDDHNKLFPPIQKASREDKAIAAYICQGAEGLQFQMIDLFAEEAYQNSFDIADVTAFFATPLHQVMKAYVFNMFELQQFDFIKNLKLQESIISKMREFQLPYSFMRNEAIFGTMALIDAKIISPQIGDTILVICVIHDELIVYEYCRKVDGYAVIERRDVDCENEMNHETLKTQILGSCEPKKILISMVMGNSNKVLANTVKNKILKALNNIVVMLEYRPETSIPKFTVAVVNHMFDKSLYQYHIFPRCHSGYAVSTFPSPASVEDALIVVNENDALPIEKSCIVPRTKDAYYLSYLHGESKKYKKVRQCESQTSNDYHQSKLSIIIDENNIPFLYLKKLILPAIKTLPSKLDAMVGLDIPVIGFFDNSAVICIKGESGYKFLDSFNGLYGNDLFLSFHRERPTLINEVDTVAQSKITLKASDILQVMSMPCENITVDPKWNFTITSDPENPVLLNFSTFEENKEASPAFLMALFLRKFVKIIKKEIGEKPKNIGICIFDVFDEDAKKKRVEDGLQEACRLIKLEPQLL